MRGSGSLFRKTYKRADGTVYTEPTWTLQFYVDGVRKREATGLTDRSQAQALLNKRLYQVVVAQYVPKAKPVRVAELYAALREHYLNDRRLYTAARLEWQWRDHLGPTFQYVVAAQLSTSQIVAYTSKRREEGAASATINRELAALRSMFSLAHRSARLVTAPPYIPMLKENNVRQGFVEDKQFALLVANAPELWLRTFLELGYTYGWRKGELLGLRVEQVNLLSGTIRLEPGTTKNKEGREVAMTATVRALLEMCLAGKSASDRVLTREPGHRPIVDLRDAWGECCAKAGLGKFTCPCGKAPTGKKCAACGRRKALWSWKGLTPHDLRRSAAKAARRAGVAESVIMVAGGWKTAAMFRRYAIVSSADQKDAVAKIEQARIVHSPANSPAREGKPS